MPRSTAYVATGEPLHVAGAFTVDSLGGAFIERVEGDPSTVVGMSVSTLRRLVRELGVEWTDLWNVTDPSLGGRRKPSRPGVVVGSPRFRSVLVRTGSKAAGVPVGRLASMPQIAKVLIANRGEIAVRVIRAARDAGKSSVAVYADQDRDALHARLADEAYALDGSTSADTYLSIEKILSVARRSGADAVHPGYGFLAENADFARAVIARRTRLDRPEPRGDRGARRQGHRPRTSPRRSARRSPRARPVRSPAPTRSSPSPSRYGLPIAIKAAYGGGGRGLKVARTLDEVPEMFESATREAITAFGRGECFVEKYLDKPRHVETQCLADAAGNVVVISTRDCSLQRRHQKLVEEAPAPFLTRRAEPDPVRRVEGDPARGRLRRRRHLRVPRSAPTARSRSSR